MSALALISGTTAQGSHKNGPSLTSETEFISTNKILPPNRESSIEKCICYCISPLMFHGQNYVCRTSG